MEYIIYGLLIAINVPFVVLRIGDFWWFNLIVIVFIACLWVDSASNYRFFPWIKSFFK